MREKGRKKVKRLKMMLNKTKEKIEDTFSLKVIGSFLKVLNKCSENKIGIPDLRAYYQDNFKTSKEKK